MKSALFCLHANEVPVICNCSKDCYCKAHTCRDVLIEIRDSVVNIREIEVNLGKEYRAISTGNGVIILSRGRDMGRVTKSVQSLKNLREVITVLSEGQPVLRGSSHVVFCWNNKHYDYISETMEIKRNLNFACVAKKGEYCRNACVDSKLKLKGRLGFTANYLRRSSPIF